MVNERGYPLRWTVVGGKTKDWTAMRGVLKQIGDVDWIRKTPIVFDCAIGKVATVADLKTAGLWFLTAAHTSSIASYTTSLLDSAGVFAVPRSSRMWTCVSWPCSCSAPFERDLATRASS